ncbi:MAG TPA: D-alanyl-D-alanine carboxypeptidase family protein [Pyrinomonadaceae bacterium]|nr:D-alanyl-D-alanine carboxypeptidase family protein [Pyrinomonadaceae bacterium]
MKQHRDKFVALFLAVSALVAVAAFNASADTGRAQTSASNHAQASSGARPTVATRERRTAEAPAASKSAVFETAAAQNVTFKNQLNWVFGGKRQLGWYLYAPLINQLIDTDKDAASPEFAAALARWQTSQGAPASGVLDSETLYRMISVWQGARLKNKVYAQPDQLLVVPVSDFYDPARPDELRQVERATYAAYKRMVAAAIADPSLKLRADQSSGTLAPEEKFLKIISSFRSREYQEKLRKADPKAGSAGLAVNSPHFTGRALDIYVGGDPVETKDANRALQVSTPVYKWLVKNAARFGFRPYYYEPWHWEYVGQ